MHRCIFLAEKLRLHVAYQNHTNSNKIYGLVLKLQGNETETLKLHYIHVYKMFG